MSPAATTAVKRNPRVPARWRAELSCVLLTEAQIKHAQKQLD